MLVRYSTGFQRRTLRWVSVRWNPSAMPTPPVRYTSTPMIASDDQWKKAGHSAASAKTWIATTKEARPR